MSLARRYTKSVAFLRAIDRDWVRLITHVGPCRHDAKEAREPYEALVRAIAYQQLTAKAGDAILGRLVSLLGGASFPRPEDLINAEFAGLRSCGFSTSKIATIQAIAHGALSGLVPSGKAAGEMTDHELIERLTTIKGVGRWTVEMLLMYSLQRRDILPADDFGVREGYRKLKRLRELPKPKALRELAEKWSPHRTVAAWYLWRMPREGFPR